MHYVTIRRCPVCPEIGRHAAELAGEIREDKELNVRVTDGAEGEFDIELNGRRIDGKDGDELRPIDDLAAEVRGAALTTIDA
jgi:hypothetical protein